MFGLLKDKLKSFIGGLTKKEEEKPAEPQPAKEEKPVSVMPKEEAVDDAIVREAVAEIREEPKYEPQKAVEAPEKEEAPKETERPKEASAHHLPAVHHEPLPKREQAHVPAPEKAAPAFELKEEPKREIAPKLGLFSRVKSIFSSNVTISGNEVEPMLDELRVSLLESDVSFDTAEFLVDDLRKRLVGKHVSKNALSESIQAEVKASLLDLFSAKPYDLAEKAKQKKPFIVLFLGPNGSGKTTTIAKISRYLSERGLSSVISASDTFRAAAIQQSEEHGARLGVRVIKHDYGADPSAVAFDAIAHAKAQNVDVVLIDTAGRQETNYNLLKEMEKINRVVKPDLKVFIGESIAGHALVEQVLKFKESFGLDGVILTKLDCDAKGGSALSLAYEAKIPILFLGTGQEYSDLIPFDSEDLVSRIVAA
ncbi:Signal recognition particle receptor FtsY [Candidatus Norongarragalina meridionalis]|nr:Signal recognition particle receptor FtsY [Candidatus Norongarragalina meridionalis]